MTDSPDLLGPALGVLAVGLGAAFTQVAVERQPDDPTTPTWPDRRDAPPPGVSVLVGAHLTGWRRRSASAQLADLVRRGALRLDPAEPSRVQVADLGGLDDVELRFVGALVGEEPRLGARAHLRADDTALAARVEEVQRHVNWLVVDQGLRRRLAPRRGRWVLRALLAASAVVAAALAFQDPRAWFVAISLGFFAVLNPRRHAARPLGDEGAALRDHLLGVQDWLRFADLDDRPHDLGALHPWAVVFGQLGAWRRRGGEADPALHELLVELRADPSTITGYAWDQPGDLWETRATGGSGSTYDGAPPPRD